MHPLRVECSRVLLALIYVSMLGISPPAFAEIFKCVAKDGSPLYQNFPCQFDSIGWVPSNLDAAKTAAKPFSTPSTNYTPL